MKKVAKSLLKWLAPKNPSCSTAKLTLAVALTCGLSGATAQADPIVVATFNSVSPSQNVSFTLNGAGVSETTTGGVFNWTTVSGAPLGNFKSFCIELTQNISYGGTYQYNLVSVPQAGNPDNGIFGPGTTGPMGAVRGDLLAELFGRHFSQVVDNQTAAAFQMDVWETVYDGSRMPGALDLTTGNFTATSNTATDALAQNWLDSLDGTGPRDSLLGLTSPEVQDQVTINSVPEPSTLLLGVIGMAALWPFIRRFRSGSKCV